MKIYDKFIQLGMGEQTKNSFDSSTLVKITKGALIAGTGAAALYGLDYLGGVDFTNTNVAALVAFMVPFLINVIKEYLKGN